MRLSRIFTATLLATAAMTASATAGGFGRGNADTDILYDDAGFNLRSGATIVVPRRGYSTINGVAATDADYTNTYVIPSAAVKLNLAESLRCAGTYVEVYGGSTDFGPQARAADSVIIPGFGATSNATNSVDLSVNEFGLTCGAKFEVGSGRAWLLGGIFGEQFNYTEATTFGTLSFDGDYKVGYRLGAAYEIPSIALRAELMYRSEVNHNPDGSFTGFVPSPAGGFALPPGAYSAVGEGTTPQSLELKLQSGIAENTLAFVNVKWTDWSVIDTLDYIIAGVVPNRNEYFWRDGWTVTGGVGRKFSDEIAGSLSLTWDRGVSTGFDILTDTWTVSSGVAMTTKVGELRMGGAVSYLTAGSQEVGKADFNATASGDWAFAVGGSLNAKW